MHSSLSSILQWGKPFNLLWTFLEDKLTRHRSSHFLPHSPGQSAIIDALGSCCAPLLPDQQWFADIAISSEEGGREEEEEEEGTGNYRYICPY